MYRTGEKSASTPAAARSIARRAIQSANDEPKGSFWSLVTAKVFTAFMFEGVVHYLGTKLSPDWESPRSRPDGEPKAALARETLEERHKAVRRMLELDNGGAEYQSIRGVIDRLVDFRHSFAHPKEIVKTVEGVVSSELDPLPEVAWDREVELLPVFLHWTSFSSVTDHL